MATVTYSSPRPVAGPSPRPRIRSRRPLELPAGMFNSTSPSSVGTLFFVPNTASQGCNVTSQVTSSPSTRNTGCFA